MGSRKGSARSRPRKPHQPHYPKTVIDIYMGLDAFRTQKAINSWNSDPMEMTPEEQSDLEAWIAKGGNVRLLS